MSKNLKKIKRLSALLAVVFGASFTIFSLLSIWEVEGFGLNYQTGAFSKLLPTLGLFTVAFLALLAVLAMLGEKN